MRLKKYKKIKMPIFIGIFILMLILLMQNCGRPVGSSLYSSSRLQNDTVTTLLPLPPMTTPAPTPRLPLQIIKDPLFAAGFRANSEFCEEWSVASAQPGVKLGDCVRYKTIPGEQFRTIPGATGPINQLDDVGKFWEFNEGTMDGLICTDPAYHTNLPAPPSGGYPQVQIGSETWLRFAPKYYRHRMASYATIVTRTPESTLAVNSNANGVVRTFFTNRNGSITYSMNTANSFRNIARSHGACYRYETWPHHHLWQTLKAPVAINQFSRIEYSFDVHLTRHRKIQDLPSYISGSLFGFTVMVRLRSNPYRAIWLGSILYQDPVNIGYEDSISVDQWGIAIANTNPHRIGGPLIVGSTKNIRFNIKDFLAEGLQRLNLQNGHTLNPDDYDIYAIGTGWEVVGQWDLEATLSNISMLGYWPSN